jgi:hypothetical protein
MVIIPRIIAINITDKIKLIMYYGIFTNVDFVFPMTNCIFSTTVAPQSDCFMH